MLRKLLHVAVIGASVFALSACAGTDNISQNGYRTNSVGDKIGKYGINEYGNHNNRSLRLNRELADVIERIDGIKRANVVVGDANAYVGVELDANADRSPALGGSHARSSSTAQGWGQTGNYYGPKDSQIVPRAWNEGNVDLNRDGRAGGMTMGRSTGLNRSGSNADLGGGRDDPASRYMYNGGAYGQMAPHLNNYNAYNGLSSQIRARVESIVRTYVPHINNVYVSDDRNFIKRLGNYSGTLDTGRPSNDVIRDFNKFVQRIFSVDGDINRYDMDNGYNQRNRNGVAQPLNNSFDVNNPRHRTGALQPSAAR